MQLLAITITFIGSILLFISLKPTHYLSTQASQSSWKTLFFLIVAFLIGYSGFLYYLLFYYDSLLIYTILSAILFLGGLFVYMVTQLSLRSFELITTVAKVTEYNSLHDSLTGLPNRKYFSNVLTEYVNDSKPFTLFALDLNNFKQVNDALGHYYGDQLLIQVTQKVTEKLNKLCVFYRTGGDEFTVILSDESQIPSLDVIEKIHSAFEETYQLMSYSVESSVSIGATKFPNDSNNIDTLLQYADLAMYSSKRTKKMCVYYDKELNKNATQQLEISGRLRKALTSKEFILYFQPIVISGSAMTHGAETLIRWPQKDGSFICPATFIPIAETSGIITQLTEWVIIEAVSQLGKLDEKGFTGSLHINLSAKDLQGESLLNLLTDLLKENILLSKRLIFEITESAMMTDLTSAKNMMIRLARLGFTFSIDDFGTGFSSLSLLRELPVQQIKIDRSFVQNMDHVDTDYAIVKSAIYLAKNLGCSVVAEGIENEFVVAALADLDCDYLQGYLYSKPIPIDQFIDAYAVNNTNLVESS